MAAIKALTRNESEPPQLWHYFSAYIYTILFLSLLYFAWWLATQSLGSPPVPYQHDPMFLRPQIRIVARIWYVLLLFFPFAIYGVIKTTRWHIQRGHYRTALVPILIWVGAMVILISDQSDALRWLID